MTVGIVFTLMKTDWNASGLKTGGPKAETPQSLFMTAGEYV